MEGAGNRFTSPGTAGVPGCRARPNAPEGGGASPDPLPPIPGAAGGPAMLEPGPRFAPTMAMPGIAVPRAPLACLLYAAGPLSLEALPAAPSEFPSGDFTNW